MALRDLKSSLKNLKFDKDTPGGGSSGLPYIKGGLPEDSPAGEYLADLARYSSNGNVRGGLYSVVASTEDTVRISRFLTDFPKGLLFTSKQVGLAKSNPKIETETRGEAINTQVYNLNSNLLAQVANQGTGEHIPYYGFNTNNLRDDKNKYEEIVSKKAKEENRLVTLYNNKILENPPLNTPNDISSLGISDNKEVLFNYSGGPGSLYGDGNTFIPRVVDTTKAYSAKGQLRQQYILDVNKLLGFSNNKLVFQNPFINSYSVESTEYQQGYGSTAVDFLRPEKSPIGYEFGNTMAYSKLLSSSLGELQDFRQNTIISSSLASDYNNGKVNIASRIGIGNPGARKDRTSINTVYEGGQDKVNMIPLYTDATNPFENKQYKDEARDIIKFAFEVIDNTDPSKTTKVHFRAFITNFSDNIGADWNGTKYMGRGESFYTYQGFTREVSFNLKVAAQSKQEMLPLYQKLNYLASSLHPDYNGSGFMRGNLHKLTVGEWFYRTPGILKSMNVSINDDYSWEIKYTEPETEKNKQTKKDYGKNDFPNANGFPGSPEFQKSNSDADQMELPQILDIQFTFTPILNELPALSKYDPSGKGIDKRGILISNDVGRTENFINRISKNLLPKPTISDPNPEGNNIPSLPS